MADADRWSRSPSATESASNTSAGSYVWRFSHPRWWSGLWQAVNRPSLPRKHYGLAVLIFQWAGRRKGGPSDFRSRPEPAPINSGPATTLLVFKVKSRVHQARSTAKSANRENSPKFALNPTGATSPVDLECRIPAKCAFFRQRARKSRKLRTRWRSEWDSNSRAIF